MRAYLEARTLLSVSTDDALSGHGCISGSSLLYVVLLQVLTGLGMSAVAPALSPPCPPNYLPVQLDGKVLGHFPSFLLPAAVQRLRAIKAAKLAAEEMPPSDATYTELQVGSW